MSPPSGGHRQALWSSAGTDWCAFTGKFRPRPLPGDYYPTPQAITEQEFENHVKQQEEKEQPQDAAGDQQPAPAATETPEEAAPAPDGKTDKTPAA